MFIKLNDEKYTKENIRKVNDLRSAKNNVLREITSIKNLF